jgi:hypothetical protein
MRRWRFGGPGAARNLITDQSTYLSMMMTYAMLAKFIDCLVFGNSITDQTGFHKKMCLKHCANYQEKVASHLIRFGLGIMKKKKVILKAI